MGKTLLQKQEYTGQRTALPGICQLEGENFAVVMAKISQDVKEIQKVDLRETKKLQAGQIITEFKKG